VLSILFHQPIEGGDAMLDLVGRPIRGQFHGDRRVDTSLHKLVLDSLRAFRHPSFRLPDRRPRKLHLPLPTPDPRKPLGVVEGPEIASRFQFPNGRP
jgi:hypothetical protein